MSSLSISPAFDFSTAARPRLAATSGVRLTQRGRVVFLIAFLACAFAVMVVFGGWATATHDSGAPVPVRYVEVHSGDTLFGIAGGIAQPGKVREMVHQIQELNSLPDAGLQVGQKLALPVN